MNQSVSLSCSDEPARHLVDALPVFASFIVRDGRYQARIEAALRGERVRFETFTPRPDGSLRDTEMEYLPRLGPDGQADGFYVLGTDITERKRGERALQQSEARLRIALDAA